MRRVILFSLIQTHNHNIISLVVYLIDIIISYYDFIFWDYAIGAYKDKNDSMIVFNRTLKNSDFSDLKVNDEELIFYKDNNIAYVIVKTDKNFVVRKYKIFNNQLINAVQLKTCQQVIKSVL